MAFENIAYAHSLINELKEFLPTESKDTLNKIYNSKILLSVLLDKHNRCTTKLIIRAIIECRDITNILIKMCSNLDIATEHSIYTEVCSRTNFHCIDMHSMSFLDKPLRKMDFNYIDADIKCNEYFGNKQIIDDGPSYKRVVTAYKELPFELMAATLVADHMIINRVIELMAYELCGVCMDSLCETLYKDFITRYNPDTVDIKDLKGETLHDMIINLLLSDDIFRKTLKISKKRELLGEDPIFISDGTESKTGMFEMSGKVVTKAKETHPQTLLGLLAPSIIIAYTIMNDSYSLIGIIDKLPSLIMHKQTESILSLLVSTLGNIKNYTLLKQRLNSCFGG